MRSRARALTLLELTVVMLLLGIIAAAAVPMLGDPNASRLRRAAQILAADLDFARADGITHGEDPLVLVTRPLDNGGDGGYHLARSSAPNTPIEEPSTRAPYDTNYGQGRAGHLAGVAVMNVDFAGDTRLSFGIYGQLDQPGPARITLGAGDYRVDLTIAPTTGEVTVSELY